MTVEPNYSSIREGDALPSFERTTDLAHWNRFAAVNDEFIPIHMDPAAAQKVGIKDVFGMGNLRISYLHNALQDWLGSAGDIVDFSVNFRDFNFQGDTLRTTAVVKGKEERDGCRLVHLELGVVNQHGKDTSPGSATVVLYEGAPRVLREPAPTSPSGQAAPGVYLDRATIDRIGETTAPQRALPVGANDIRRWAMACHYPQQVPAAYYDEQVAARGPWGGLVAPREFNPFAWLVGYRLGDPWLRGMGTEPGTRVLNGGQRNRYFAPIRPGDVISETSRLADVWEKLGKTGAMLFFLNERTWRNQAGDLVRVGNQTTIYY